MPVTSSKTKHAPRRKLSTWEFIAGMCEGLYESVEENKHFRKLADKHYSIFLNKLERNFDDPEVIENSDYPGIGFEVDSILYNFQPRGKIKGAYGVDENNPNMIILPILDDPAVISWSNVKKVREESDAITHELIHVMNFRRSEGRARADDSGESDERYFNNPLEYNAFSHEIIDLARKNVKSLKDAGESFIRAKARVLGFLQLGREGKPGGYREDFLSNISEKNYKRLVDRVLTHVEDVYVQSQGHNGELPK